MGVLDFLFEGNPPPSVNTYGTTIDSIPTWLSDYTQGLVAKANVAAAEPYIPYGGPRIAPFTEDTENAFGMVRENVGSYKPFLGSAGAGGAAGVGGIESGLGFLGEAGGATYPENVDAYMNPYIQNVLDRQETLATRNLTENFIPKLQRAFTGAGTFGSRGGRDSMEDVGVRGVRDITEGLEEQRLATLGDAFYKSGDVFAEDMKRRGTAGAAMGDIGVTSVESMGKLGEFAQKAGLTDASAIEEIGNRMQGQDQASFDLAYRDFLEQRDLPFERVNFMSGAIQGIPYSEARQTQGFGPTDTYQPSGLAQIAGAYGVYQGLRSARGGLARVADVREHRVKRYA